MKTQRHKKYMMFVRFQEKRLMDCAIADDLNKSLRRGEKWVKVLDLLNDGKIPQIN